MLVAIFMKLILLACFVVSTQKVYNPVEPVQHWLVCVSEPLQISYLRHCN